MKTTIPAAGEWFTFEGKLVQVQSATCQAVRIMFWVGGRIKTLSYEQWSVAVPSNGGSIR